MKILKICLLVLVIAIFVTLGSHASVATETPVISYVIPALGVAGNTAFVNSNIACTATIILFDGVVMPPSPSYEEHSCEFIIPANATDGKHALQIKDANSGLSGVVTNFEVAVPPRVTSSSPLSAKIGDTVTVYGSGFNKNTFISYQPFDNFQNPIILKKIIPTSYTNASFTFVIPTDPLIVSSVTGPLVAAKTGIWNLAVYNWDDRLPTLPNYGNVYIGITPSPLNNAGTNPAGLAKFSVNLVSDVSSTTPQAPIISSISPIFNTGGTLTVNGLYFDSNSLVSLDGSSSLITPSSQSPTTFLVTLPNSITLGSHTIQVKEGTALSNSISFTVLPQPQQGVIGYSVSPTSVAPGGTLTVYGSDLNRVTRNADGSTTPAIVRISIDGSATLITPTAQTAISLDFVVPTTLANGPHAVQITLPGYSVPTPLSIPLQFTVTGSSVLTLSTPTPPVCTSSQILVNNVCVNLTSPTPISTQPSGSYDFGTTTLYRGVNGDAVKELQRFFNIRMNLDLIVDGKFGLKTTEAVKNWQKSYGLKIDGRVGPKTKIRMNEEIQHVAM